MATEDFSMDALYGQDTIQFARMMKTAYLNYAVETIKDRALPDVRDGLKPVHRRILYTMHDMGLRSSVKHRKSARVVGDVMGKYHPHGDGAIYDAMVRLAQDFTMRAPLVDGQGNFGSIDGDAAAAMRYTEARMSPIADELMIDIDANTVDWHENFDNTLKEPSYLPAKFPNLLVNGSEGIAVGMSCKMPPHNLGEICDATVHVAQHWAKREQIPLSDLLDIVQGPDFPTGGIIYRKRLDGEEEVDIIEEVYRTGQGKLITQGIISGEDSTGNPVSDLTTARRLIVTEIPYGLNKSTLLTQIADGVRNEKIKGISDLRDESDYEGMRIVITVTRGYQADKVLQQLLRRTSLKNTYGVISLALVQGEPEYLPLLPILTHFIAHRLDVIIRRTQYELARREARLHIVAGLLKALDVIDQVIDTIRRSRNTETARTNLMKNLSFSQEQAQAILDMQLRRLAALERKKLDTEQRELQKRIKYLNNLLASEKDRLAVIVEETTEIKEQYGTPRKTVILDQVESDGLVTKEDLMIPKGPQVIAATTRGNLYRVPLKNFNGRQAKGLTKRGVDAPLFYLHTEAEAKILLVSNKGRTWHAPIFRVPEQIKNTEMGLERGEIIISANVIDPQATEAYITLAASNGKVKRTALADLKGSESYWNGTMGGLEKGDQVVAAGITNGTAKVMLFTRGGKAIKFEESAVNPQASGTATGVAALKIGKDDAIISGSLIQEEETTQVVLIVSEKGWAKQIDLIEFPVQGRGGQGVQTLKATDTTGKVAAATVAQRDGTVNVISGKGRRNHLAVEDFAKSNRVNRGEELIDFGADDTIQQVNAF
ncbi:MAG: DNA topoisomerase (ATP-hydrolyzing) [Chloroflexota bacterium]